MADSIPDNGKTAQPNEHGGAAADQEDQLEGSPSQDRPRRFSQYAEAIANPLPQIVFESVPEPVSNLEELECDDAASMRPVVQPDDPVDRRSSAVVYAGEKPSRFRKYRIPIIVGLIILVIILTGTVIGVVLANRGHNGSGGGASRQHYLVAYSNFKYHDFVSGQLLNYRQLDDKRDRISGAFRCYLSYVFLFDTIFHPAIIKIPNSGDAFLSSVPSQCADTSDYLTSVSFMSIVGGTGYNVEYQAIENATDCCIYCYTQVDDGCDSWYWNGGFIGTACSMITGWKGTGSDSTCPNGHTKVSFQRTAKNESLVGGAGPCASISSSRWSL